MERIGALQTTLERLLQLVCGNFADQLGGRRGGWFCLFSPVSKEVVSNYHFPVGEFPTEKNDHYRAFSSEKNIRLSQHHDHVSSWQSRKPDAKMYGGSIRGRTYLFSFSGLPELLDEALVTVLAYLHDELTDEDMTMIIKHSQNPFTEKLLELYYKTQTKK